MTQTILAELSADPALTIPAYGRRLPGADRRDDKPALVKRSARRARVRRSGAPERASSLGRAYRTLQPAWSSRPVV